MTPSILFTTIFLTSLVQYTTSSFLLGSVKNWTAIYGSYVRNTTVQVVDLDLESTSAETIGHLRSQGKKIICYFSAGSYEDWRNDKSLFQSSDLGQALDGWPGERWLDIRTSNVKDVMYKRIQQAHAKGCNAVDPDNVDGYLQNTGFDLTYQDQLVFNRYIASTSHSFNLSVGLKNDLEQVSDLVDWFDFAMNEQCLEYTTTIYLSKQNRV